MEKKERRDYLKVINEIVKDLTDDSLKAVYETALICRNNEKSEKTLEIKKYKKGKKW